MHRRLETRCGRSNSEAGSNSWLRRRPPPLVQTFEGRGVVARTNEIVIDFSERDKDTIRPPGLRIDDYETFEPRRVEVPAGTRVTWKNTGARAAHD